MNKFISSVVRRPSVASSKAPFSHFERAQRPSVTSSAARSLSLLLSFCFLLSAFCVFSACDCADCYQSTITPTSCEVNFPDEGGDQTIWIPTSCCWNVVQFPDWVTTTPMKGCGPISINIMVEENAGSPRTGEVLITTDCGDTVIITVHQGAEPIVYVAGYELSGVYNGGKPERNAVLWVNGEKKTLSTKHSQANAVFVTKKGKVYVAGYEFDGGGPNATLWVDGVKQPLTGHETAFHYFPFEVGSEATSVFVSDNGTVYVTGCGYQPSDDWNAGAILWVNGTLQSFQISTGYAASVFVKDGTAYIAGGQEFGSFGGPAATLWIGEIGLSPSYAPSTRGGDVEIPNYYPYLQSSRISQATSVFVAEDGKIYVAGYEGYYNRWNEMGDPTIQAVLWKEGSPSYLADYGSRATSVFVTKNGTVYAVGQTGGIGFGHATLWKNGEEQKLSESHWNYASSVFVTEGGTVYVAGAGYFLYPESTPVFWKDGAIEYLPTAEHFEAPKGGAHGIGAALSIFVR